jgi:cytoskeletal protein RodZ
MKRHGNLHFIIMFAVLLFVTGRAAMHGQSPQRTGDQDQSASDTAKKKTTASPSAPKSQGTPASSSASTPSDSTNPANKPDVASQTTGNAPAGNAPTSKPDTTRRTQPAKGSGMVWVNTDSGVYHKPGTRWYGKTRKGKYMTEADALKAGYRAATKNPA